MTNWTQAQRRLLTSARILKAYYESKLKMDLELLTEAPEPRLDGDVSFSESVSGFGLWGLRPSKPISEEVRNEIATMCESILAGLENMETKREALERMQVHMEQSLNGEMPSNVISLRRRAPVRVHAPVRERRTVVLRSDCLIEAGSPSEILKMAEEIHSRSTRSAFVEFAALDIQKRQSISQLMSLGTITLFVPSIMQLTSYEQEILRHLVQQDVLQRPLLMVGCPMPYSELIVQSSLDEQFLSLIGRSYIKLTRPFSEYKEQGLIHYFLDSLSSSPT
jgi:hypothetical protein